jgi:hypothetical protein
MGGGRYICEQGPAPSAMRAPGGFVFPRIHNFLYKYGPRKLVAETWILLMLLPEILPSSVACPTGVPRS